jgi:FKBP-type peptidyl-prolyl cis-trans isomerase SlyD
MDVEIGTLVAANGPDGQMEFTIIDIKDDIVTLDANHPLAGKNLTFSLVVEAVREAHKDEIKHKRPHPAGHHLMVEDSSFH